MIAMVEVPLAIRAVVLGRLKIEPQQLITLSGVLQRSLMRGFDPQIRATTVNTTRALPGPGIHLDRNLSINRVDGEFSNA
jgi:hypothetical protein